MTRENPNIVLVVMDTARARTVFERSDALPNLRRIASQGTRFTNAFTTAPWTLPSHASMFTGRYTSTHGSHAGSKRFAPSTAPLPRLLRAAGYQTVGFSNNAWISPEFGFDAGFDTFRTNLELVEGGDRLETIAKEHTGTLEQAKAVGKRLCQRGGGRTAINAMYAKYLRGRYDDGARLTNWRIRRWFSRHYDRDRPFFLFANYLEPHLEYDPPASYRREFLPDGVSTAVVEALDQDPWRYISDPSLLDDDEFELLRCLYEAELSYLDHRLGRLYDLLEAVGVRDETLLVVCGDHGENLGEHQLMDHQYCLYDTLLHVPLVVRYPDRFPAGATCESLVELRDVFPTLVNAAGTDPADSEAGSVAGHTLETAITEGGRERVFAEYLTPQPSMEALEQRVGSLPESVRKYDRGLRSVRTSEWKLVEGSDGSTELYHVATDPHEETDVAEANPKRVIELAAVLEERFGSFERGTTTTDERVRPATQRRLEELGYL